MLLHYQLLVGTGKRAIIIFSCVPIHEPRFSRWFKTHGYAESPGKVNTLKTKTKTPEHEKWSCKVARWAAVGEKRGKSGHEPNQNAWLVSHQLHSGIHSQTLPHAVVLKIQLLLCVSHLSSLPCELLSQGSLWHQGQWQGTQRLINKCQSLGSGSENDSHSWILVSKSQPQILPAPDPKYLKVRESYWKPR